MIPNSPSENQNQNQNQNAAEYATVLENFHLEVRDKIAQLETQLQLSQQELEFRGEAEIQALPEAISSMTMAEFVDSFGGNLDKAISHFASASLSTPVSSSLSTSTRLTTTPLIVPETPNILKSVLE